MTASILKQDPNTRRFQRTLIYFDTDIQYANFWQWLEEGCRKPVLRVCPEPSLAMGLNPTWCSLLFSWCSELEAAHIKCCTRSLLVSVLPAPLSPPITQH